MTFGLDILYCNGKTGTYWGPALLEEEEAMEMACKIATSPLNGGVKEVKVYDLANKSLFKTIGQGSLFEEIEAFSD